MSDDTDLDPTPAQKPLAVFTCINRRHPSRSCHALIENVPEVRQAHRQWHVDQETDREALRAAVKKRDEKIAELRQEISGYRRDVAEYDSTVRGFHGEVQRVEAPVVPPQLEIDRGAYSDDELDDEPDDPAPSTSLDLDDDQDDDEDPAEDPAEHSQYADDEDDDLHTVSRPSTPSWAR